VLKKTSLSCYGMALSICGASLIAHEHSFNNFFLKAGVGGSFSRDADICVDSRQWNRASEGYTASVGKSELYTVAAGYTFNKLFSTECEVTVRPSFRYQKFQTPLAASTFSFAGLTPRTRFFRLSNTAIMANLYCKGAGVADKLAWKFCDDDWLLQPVLGAGLGISYTNLYDFHTVFCDEANIINLNGLITRRVASVELPYTNRSLSGQVMVGFELTYENFLAYVGYRYFNGGSFKSNNYLTSRNASTDGTHAGTSVPWKGKLRAHEFVVNIGGSFDI
ncbi:MAG: hypothetical protein U1E02_07010, partial [Hydrogenophaga sp.]|nr:hypothetical protein [Hydrogenophaga sp.]